MATAKIINIPRQQMRDMKSICLRKIIDVSSILIDLIYHICYVVARSSIFKSQFVRIKGFSLNIRTGNIFLAVNYIRVYAGLACRCGIEQITNVLMIYNLQNVWVWVWYK